MKIGVPKETKDHEFRVGLSPAGAHVLASHGHDVAVQSGAGAAIGFDDTTYVEAGARIVANGQEAYAADMVIKVKEPQAAEYDLTHAGQILFCYQHFAPAPDLLAAMLARKVTCIAYETVTAADGSFPLLIPMSEIAGRLAVQVGAWALQMANGGNGILLSGVAGVPPAKVVIIGGGTVGTNAARIALGFGADVTLLDESPERLRTLEAVYGAHLKTCYSEPQALRALLRDADLVIGAVLLPGKLSPKLITREDVAAMRNGSVIVDVGIDQGGIAETSHPTTHSDPIFIESGVVHYCVPNMPAAVSRTATLALTHATLPYATELANQGLNAALTSDAGLRGGLEVHAGCVTHPALAADVGRDYVPALEALKR
jgi:alanine dehydrogenase